MTILHMTFLGVPELHLDGVPVRLKRRYSLALLAYLVLTGRAHPREELAALLAETLTDEPARKLVRNALADLSEQGLGGYILADRQSVAFDSSRAYTLDIERINELAAPGSDPGLDALTLAAECCDAELLSGLMLHDAPQFELWLLTERERLREKLARIARDVLERQVAEDRLEAGIALARRLLAVEPWDESTHPPAAHATLRARRFGQRCTGPVRALLHRPRRGPSHPACRRIPPPGRPAGSRARLVRSLHPG